MNGRQAMRTLWIVIALLAALGAPAASAQDKLEQKGAGFDDAVITQLVTRALDHDALLREMHISVETRDRVVHLSGFVNSMAQVDRAEALARRVDGVSGVRNALRVANRPSRA